MPCRKSRKNCQAIYDYGEEHVAYMQAWGERRYLKDGEKRVVDWDVTVRHMSWYDDDVKYHVRLRPQWAAADIASLSSDDPEEQAYNANIRESLGEFREYALLMNRVVSCVQFFGADISRRIYFSH